MTLKKFYAIYIFLLLPVAVGLVLYFTIKYGLSAKEMMFLLLFLSFSLSIPPLAVLEFRSIREVDRFIEVTGLKSSREFIGKDRGTLIAQGEYGGLRCKVYRDVSNPYYSDEIITITVELPVGVNPERVASAVKGVSKVNRVKLNGNWIEIRVLEGDVESFTDLLRVLNTVLRAAGVTPPVRDREVIG